MRRWARETNDFGLIWAHPSVKIQKSDRRRRDSLQ
jgi:hypothetical protein